MTDQKKRLGRPPQAGVTRTVKVTVRLTPEMDAALTQMVSSIEHDTGYRIERSAFLRGLIAKEYSAFRKGRA